MHALHHTLLLAAGALIWTARERRCCLARRAIKAVAACLTPQPVMKEKGKSVQDIQFISLLCIEGELPLLCMLSNQRMSRCTAARAVLISLGSSCPIPALHDALSEPRPCGRPRFINATSTVGGQALKSTLLHDLNTCCTWPLTSLQRFSD